MEYDEDKVDEAVLALLHLNVCEENEWAARAWKGMPWEATDRLHDKGLIGDPRNKAKSVVLTEEGRCAARRRSGVCSHHEVSD